MVGHGTEQINQSDFRLEGLLVSFQWSTELVLHTPSLQVTSSLLPRLSPMAVILHPQSSLSNQSIPSSITEQPTNIFQSHLRTISHTRSRLLNLHVLSLYSAPTRLFLHRVSLDLTGFVDTHSSHTLQHLKNQRTLTAGAAGIHDLAHVAIDSALAHVR